MMIKIDLYIGTEPVKNKNTTTYGRSKKGVSIDAIKNGGNHSKPCYQARVFQPEVNAPYDHMQEGEVWKTFYKKDVPHLKIPVMKPGQMITTLNKEAKLWIL